MHESNKPLRATRIASVFVFMFMLAITANAYTVVMRGGRRIEIPSRFVVTATTLTYETAPGVQITLQMSAIDVGATDDANNEQPGSLWRRAHLTPQSSPSTGTEERDVQTPQATSARRTITNRDLQSSMRRRRESELAYESRRKQLGLPSVAESRRQAAAESAAIAIELEQRRVVTGQTEEYWRGRAASLRTEMAELDAKISWIGARLDEGPFQSSNGWGNGSYTSVTTVSPFTSFGNFGGRSFGNFGAGGFRRSGARGGPDVFVAPGQNMRTTGRDNFGRGGRRHGFINPGAFPYAPPPGFGNRYPYFPGVDVFGSMVPYDYSNDSYERSELVNRFNQLAAERAGLNARWRALEEEARRAGASPGWLRP